MNSSNNSNYGSSSSGFRSSNEMNYGLNSPPLGPSSGKAAFGSSGSGLSRPRLQKVRKQVKQLSRSENRRNDLGFGFNPFGPPPPPHPPVSENLNVKNNVGNEAFLFGANRSNLNWERANASSSGGTEILDDMRKLRIAAESPSFKGSNLDVSGRESLFRGEGSDSDPNKKGMFVFGNRNKGGVDESHVSQLGEDMRKLNFKNDGIGGNPTSSSIGIAEQLPFEIKKLNIQDPVNTNDMNKFASVNEKIGKKNSFGSDRMESMVLDEMGKLKIAGGAGNTNEKKVEFNFSTQSEGIGFGTTQQVEFKTPKPRGTTLFSSFNRKAPLSEAKRESRKKKGKLKKPPPPPSPPVGQWFSNENTESFDSYSPMDVSPYRETPPPPVSDDISFSRENLVTSDEAFNLDNNYDSSESRPTVLNDATDEDLAAATNALDIDEDSSEYCFDKGGVGAEGSLEDSVSGAETESFMTASEQLDYGSDTFVTAFDNEVSSSFGSTIERQNSDGKTQFKFVSNASSEDNGKSSFSFAASSSAQSQSSSARHHHKKKNQHRLKIGHDSYSSSTSAKGPYASPPAQFFQLSGNSPLLSPRSAGNSPHLSPRKGKMGDHLSSSSSKSGDNLDTVKGQDVKQEIIATPDASTVAQEACEKRRLWGNQAYASGNLSKAEEYYTQGVNCVSQNETSRSCLRALMLCYSNRAATRMSLGRMREALKDCMMAASLDPNFLRVQVRAANCYLALGEIESASLHFLKCLQSGSDVCVDRKLLIEASEGLEKAQKVSECIKQSTGLWQRRTLSDAEFVLGVVDDALTISSYSEKLLETKADVLFMLRKYEQVIQLCEQTFHSAELNSGVDTHSTDLDDSDPQSSSFRLWRCHLIIKAYFYLGKLEEALDFLKKQEESLIIKKRNGSKSLQSAIPLAGTIRELLRHKAAGNEAYLSGRHAEAVEHYTAALSCNIESRPFAAICFCNRAAAYSALGQITDAIADCSLAIALDGSYTKAISRRANLYEMIRDYGQASVDIQRIVSLLTKQIEKSNQSAASDRMSCVNELRQTQQRLSVIEEESRKEIPLNMYLILGIEPSAAASEIKKAYRKAALKHHPDKTGQTLARSENGDDGLWKEIAEEVHKDADRLFKMIGEAYAVLSDHAKRSRYDLEEEMRNGHNASSLHADSQNYPFEKSGGSSRRQWQEVWKSYGTSQPRAYERSRSNRYS